MKVESIISLLTRITLILVFSLAFNVCVYGAELKSQQDAVNWTYAQEGKFLDCDGAYGAQCVDLIQYYYSYLGQGGYARGNGYDYVSNPLPNGWIRIKNTPEFIPQPGDIAVWGKELSQWGHVAIILSANSHSFVSMDQNWPRNSPCKQVTHNYNNFWGVIRPKFNMKPSYSNISTYKSVYGLHEKIGFNIQASNVDRMTIGVDTVGVGRAFTESCDFTGNYETWASNIGFGSYSAYFTLYNGGQYIDTGRVLFSIKPPSYSHFSVSKSAYGLHENINFSINAAQTQYMIIGIDKEGEGRVHTERFDPTNNYGISAEKLGLGDYTAYISLYSTDHYNVDTKKVSFSVKEPDYTHFSVSKSAYGLHENINFSINATQTQYMIIGINKEGEGRVHTEMFDPTNNYGILANKLGVGDYTAYISLYSTNDCFVDTEKVHFSIKEPSYKEMSISKPRYELNEQISFHLNVAQTEFLIIGIDQIGKGRVFTQRCDSLSEFKIAADELGLGEYTAYFTLYSHGFDYYTDTTKVTFTVEEKIIEHVHEKTVIPGIQATCTQSGKTAGWKCSSCGVILEKQQIIPALGHRNTEVRNVKNATCTQEGYSGDTYCLDCGTKISSGKVIPKTAHKEIVISQIQASCTQTGKTAGKKCSSCGVILEKQQIIPALGHRNTEVRNVKNATCTQEGYSGDTYCLDCGTKISSGKVIPKTQHKETVIPEIQATCTESGKTEGRKCSSCGVILEKQQIIPALGHRNTEVRNVKNAACTQEGYSGDTYCLDCGTKISSGKVIPKTQHKETVIPGIQASCTESGKTEGRKCLFCGVILEEQKIISALGHSIVIDEPLSATYFSTGKTEGEHCSKCGVVLKSQQVISKIALKAPKVKLKVGKKKVNVKFSKVIGVTKYEIKIQIGKKWRRYITSKTSYTIKNLKKSKYKVKVRAIVVDGAQKIYSNYSKVKKIKIRR